MARTPPPQFTIARLALAITCFAVAFGVIAFCCRWPQTHTHDLSDLDITVIWLWMLAPFLGADIGFGIGLLFNRRLRGMLAGVVTTVVIDLLAVGLVFFP